MLNSTVFALIQGFSSIQNSFSLTFPQMTLKSFSNLQFCEFHKKINPILYNPQNFRISTSHFSYFLTNAIISSSDSICSDNTITANPSIISNCIFKEFHKEIIYIINTDNNLDIHDTIFFNCSVYGGSLLFMTSKTNSLASLKLNGCCFLNTTSYSSSSLYQSPNGIISTSEVQLTIERNSIFGPLSNDNQLELNPAIKHSYQKFYVIYTNITSHHQINSISKKTLFDINAYKDLGKDVDIKKCAFGFNTGKLFISLDQYSATIIEDCTFLNNTSPPNGGYGAVLIYIGDPVNAAQGNMCMLQRCIFANNERLDIYSIGDKVNKFSIKNNFLDTNLPSEKVGDRVMLEGNTENCRFDQFELRNWIFNDKQMNITSNEILDQLYIQNIECKIYIKYPPTPSATPMPTPSKSPSASPSKSPSPTPSKSSSASPSKSSSPTPSKSPSESPSKSSSPTPSASSWFVLIGSQIERSFDQEKDDSKKKIFFFSGAAVAAAVVIAVLVGLIVFCKKRAMSKNSAEFSLLDESHNVHTYTNEFTYDTDDPFAEDFVDAPNEITYKI